MSPEHVQIANMPKNTSAAAPGASMRAASPASAAKTIAINVAARRPGSTTAALRHQIMDCRRMNIDAGNRTPFELPGDGCAGGSAQRGARDPSSPVAKRLEVNFRSSAPSSVPKMTILPANSTPKKIRIVALDAGTQIGERERPDIIGAALEIQCQRIRHRARNEIAREHHASICRQAAVRCRARAPPTPAPSRVSARRQP